jgi:hypothetical protein
MEDIADSYKVPPSFQIWVPTFKTFATLLIKLIYSFPHSVTTPFRFDRITSNSCVSD